MGERGGHVKYVNTRYIQVKPHFDRCVSYLVDGAGRVGTGPGRLNQVKSFSGTEAVQEQAAGSRQQQAAAAAAHSRSRQQAAAGRSSRQQAAAGSSSRQRAAGSSSRHQQQGS